MQHLLDSLVRHIQPIRDVWEALAACCCQAQ